MDIKDSNFMDGRDSIRHEVLNQLSVSVSSVQKKLFKWSPLRIYTVGTNFDGFLISIDARYG